ncbi:MAG: alpha/beta hydrolase [Gemmatimonadales bacterium]
MATPTLTTHTMPGALGEILVDLRSAGRESSRPAVVVAHGFKGFKNWGMFPPLAERLARAGYTAVSFNFSGSGVDDRGEFTWPERFGHNTFSAELTDLGAVVDALAGGGLGATPPSWIGLIGHSRGGGMAVLHSARDPRIRALATWAAISHVDRWPTLKEEWRAKGRTDVVNTRTGQVLPLYTDVLDDVERNAAALDIRAAAARITIPWLIVHGEADESVPIREGEALKQASPGESTRLMRIPEGGHTFGAAHPWKGATPELERVFDASLSFLNTHLS